jgi:hypothetical protein
MGDSLSSSVAATRCVVEALEPRELFSAATVWTSLMPLTGPRAHHEHGVHASPHVGKVVPRVTYETGPDILGTWTGKFTYNTYGHKIVNGSIKLTSRHKDSFTGVFDMSGIGGGSILSTVTVTKNRAFNAVLKNGKLQVSIAAVVTSDLKYITGRWSFESSTGWFTGVFTLSRAG